MARFTLRHRSLRFFRISHEATNYIESNQVSAVLSGDGTTIAIATTARLSPLDQNPLQDVYLFDVQALQWAPPSPARQAAMPNEALVVLAGFLLVSLIVWRRGQTQRRGPHRKASGSG